MRVCVPSALLVFVLALHGVARAAEPVENGVITGPLPVNWLAEDDAATAPLPSHEWRLDWQPVAPVAVGSVHVTFPAATAGQTTPPGARPVAFEYSDAYNTRRKIHYYASFATLPLFVTQYVLGDKLYDGTASDGQRSAHSAIATSLVALFGVNTVTGVWNLWEARNDPNHRTKRTVHGILMLGASAGFVATGLLAPETEDGVMEGDRDTHRTVALTSMGVATASYLLMLFTR